MSGVRSTRPLALRVLECVVSVGLLSACGGAAAGDGRGDSSVAAVPLTGEQLYQQRCVICHQAQGRGIPGSYTPLTGTGFATAENPAAAIRVILLGMQGPVTVDGQTYNAMMPAYGTGAPMTDEEIATVLTYVRASWGNTASAVTPEQVARERQAVAGRGRPVQARELESLR